MMMISSFKFSFMTINNNMHWFVVLFFIALAIVSFTHYYAYTWRRIPKSKGRKLPPGSMGFPLIGETIQFLIPSYSLDVPPFVKKRIVRYGPLFRTSLAGRRIVVSTDAEFNYYILQQEGKLVQLWYMDSISAILGETLNGNTTSYIHKYVRNVILNHLGTESLKEKLLSKLELMANQGLRSWSSSTQSSIEVKSAIASMIFELSSKQLLNYDSTKKSSKNLSKILCTDFLQSIMSIPLNIPGTAFHRCMKNQKEALKAMKDILHERLNSPEKRHGDLLDQLIDDMKREEFLNEEFVVLTMLAILLASFETTSTTLTLAMILLTDHPLVAKELMEEQEAIVKSRENVDSPLTWKEFKSMTFMPQVINETLRMSSIAPGILRKVIKDIHINGYVIPEGWTILIVPSALHMDPKKFKDPLSFDPWRWNVCGRSLARSSTSGKSFIPFGGGIRNCAGSEFSRVLMSVFMHVLVTKYSWTKVKGGQAARTPALTFGDGFYIKILEKSGIKAPTHVF